MSSHCSRRRGVGGIVATLLASMMPAALAAQWGISAGRTESLVRWDYTGCGDSFCVIAAQAHAPRTSVNIGVTYDRSVLSWITFQGEARLVTKGYTVTGPELDLHYLEVPLLFRIDLPRHAARVTPFVVGGVAPAVKLECSLESWGCQKSTIGDRRIRPFDLSGVFGGGFELRAGEHAFDVEYRLTHGWRNIGYEDGLMRNILVSFIGVDYRHLGAPDPVADPFVSGGVIGAARTVGNTCGVVHQGTGIAGEVHFRQLAGGSWWTSRIEGGATYFPDSYTDDCTRPSRRLSDSDVRAMSGFTTLGPAFVFEPAGRAAELSPYLHVSVGGFAARLDDASPGYGRVALGSAFGGSVGARIRHGNTHLTAEVRLQTLAPVLGQRVNIVGVGFGLMP